MANQYNRKLISDDFFCKVKIKFPSYTFYDDYKTSRTPISIMCPIHGMFKQTPELLLKNTKYTRLTSNHSGCQKCAQIKIIQDTLITINEKYNFDYTYPLNLNVLNNETFIAKCSKHGEFKTSLKLLKKGTQCLKCSIKNVSSVQKDTLESFTKKSNIIHNNYYDYSGVFYEKSQTKINIGCPEHGIFNQTPNHHLMGQGCPKCSTIISKPENEIIEYLKPNNLNIIQNNRTLLNGLELDIYLPDEKFAIEYNGLIWHSIGSSDSAKFNKENTQFNKNKHYNKTNICADKGIQLFHIFENEWLDTNTRKKWLNVISNKLNLNEKIGARKTEVRTVELSIAKKFENENHLQNSCASSIKIGLYFNNELVSLMTFGKPRMSNKYQYELIRFCSKDGLVIQGGASKLLSHFEKKYNPTSLVSYANRRWSEGNLYYKLGFSLSHIAKPNYFYFKDKYTLYSRNKFQKHKLKNILKKFNPDKTEWENMDDNRYRKIYDSGNYVFIKNYK